MTLVQNASKIVSVGCLSRVGVWMSQSKGVSRRSLKPKVNVHFSNLSPKHMHSTCDQIPSDWFEGTWYLDLWFSPSNKLRGIIWDTTGMMVASSLTDQQITYQIKLESISWTGDFYCSPPPGAPSLLTRFGHSCLSFVLSSLPVVPPSVPCLLSIRRTFPCLACV